MLSQKDGRELAWKHKAYVLAGAVGLSVAHVQQITLKATAQHTCDQCSALTKTVEESSIKSP